MGVVAAAVTFGRGPVCEGGEVVRAGNGIVSCVFGGPAEVEAIVEGGKGRDVGLLFRNRLCGITRACL